MKRNKVLIVSLSVLTLFMLSGCSKPKLTENVVPPSVQTQIDNIEMSETTKNETKKENIQENATQDVVNEIMGDAVGEKRSSELLELDLDSTPLKVTHRSYIDDLGVHNLEYTYTMPENADISKVISPKIMVNGAYFVVDSIYKPQAMAAKTVEKTKIVHNKNNALVWNDTLEYNGPDGKGTLNLDKSSIKVAVNSEKTNTHKVSATKSFQMNIKDEDAVPKAIKSGKTTLYLNNVSWSETGDGGQDNFGGEIGNTVTRTFTATAYYGGAYNTKSRDFKGTAIYTGMILVKNSPQYDYVVTYKPDYVHGIKNNKDSAISAMYGIRNSGMLYSLLILTFLMFITLALLFIYLLISKARKQNVQQTFIRTLPPTNYEQEADYTDMDEEYFKQSDKWQDWE